MFVVCTCPVAKIFVRYLQLAEQVKDKSGKLVTKLDQFGQPVWEKNVTTKAQLLKKPELIFSDIPFQVSFVSPVHGEVKFTFGVPTFVGNNFFPRMRAEDRANFIQFLTGGRNGGDSAETNYTGLVQLEYTPEELGMLNYIAVSGVGIPDSFKARQKEVYEAAKAKSEVRVMSYAKKLLGHALDQNSKNKQAGLGTPELREVEYLLTHVFKDTTVRESLEAAEHQRVFESLV